MTFTVDDIINQKLKNMLSDIESGGMGINLRESLRLIQAGVRKEEKPANEMI